MYRSCTIDHESEASCIVFIIKVSFHSCVNKTNFYMKSFALSLAFVMRLEATRNVTVILYSVITTTTTTTFYTVSQESTAQ